jgi:hypothetical protein
MPDAERIQHYRDEAKRMRALAREAVTTGASEAYEAIAHHYNFLASETKKLANPWPPRR